MKVGTLYICATPIGNLEDISARAARILGEVALIACEDTRRTQKLLAHLGLHTPLYSYHDHSESKKTDGLIRRLLDGETIALVSDAGTPVISDPGYPLVEAAIENHIPIVPVPGPFAAAVALTVSGLPPHPFYFGGFLPRKKGERRRLLQSLEGLPATLIFYESPHRLIASLSDAAELWPHRRGAVARELTKMHEEILRGTLASLVREFKERKPRGECVLLIEGAREIEALENAEAKHSSGDASHQDVVLAKLMDAMNAGKSKKEAIKQVASSLGLDRRSVYRVAVSIPASHGEVSDREDGD